MVSFYKSKHYYSYIKKSINIRMDKIMDKQWPELLGVDINYAKEEILRTNPGL